MLYTVRFENNNDLANFGKIVVTALENEGTVGNHKVWFGLTDPTGLEIKVLDSLGSPDMEFAENGTASVAVDIPATDNVWLQGTYTVSIVYAFNNVQAPVFANQLYYCPNRTVDSAESAALALTAEFDCDDAEITATGAVSGDGYVVQLEEISLYEPPVGGNPAVTHTVSGNTITATFFWTYVTWIAAYVIKRTKTTSDGDVVLVISEKLSTQQDVVINCSLTSDVCKLAACLESFYNECSAAASRTGWMNLNPALAAKMNQIGMLSIQIFMYQKCQNNSKVSEFMTKLQAVLACDCGCEQSSQTPQPYVAV